MISHPHFAVEPWRLRERALDLEVLAQSESLFALSNGHLGLRGNLDEGEPRGMPGTYLGGFYETYPLSRAEPAYGDPEAGQLLLNVTNGKLLRLLVDDEPFDVRYGTLHSHERVLDMRAGTLAREVRWESPAGQVVRVSSTRLVSFTQRAIAAIAYEVEAIDDEARVVIQSELVANEASTTVGGDPRAASPLESPLVAEHHATWGRAGVDLVHRTEQSGLRVAVAMDHVIEGPSDIRVQTESEDDLGRVSITVLLQPGERLRVVKFIAYGWSGTRSAEALRDQVAAALTAARDTGWDRLLTEQREFLDRFWERSDVAIEGDPEIQQAVRFGLFHVLQAGARGEQRAIPAKGLTGSGYDGHTFWDSETFVLPVLTYTMPDAAAQVLRWRHDTLPAARTRAKALGLRGAALPWRTIAGEECSGYWPAGTAAFHVNADVAAAVIRYVDATDDMRFEQDIGLELLVESARLWHSLGHHDREGQFHLPGVTGPDEYSALADDNVYTNLTAQQNFEAAAVAAERHPHEASELGVDATEVEAWRTAAASMFVPYDEALGVHPQAAGFTSHAMWDFEATQPTDYPLFLHFPYFDLYRKQVVKQADLVLALHLRGDAFTAEEKARDFAYYEPLTVRDSSLSAATQSVIAAEVGHLDLAYDYVAEAALIDLENLEHNTRDGLHIAALAGTWTALVAGFGGFRAHEGQLRFAPRLPRGMMRLEFRLLYRGRQLRVTLEGDAATYTLEDGDPLELRHHGEALLLRPDKPLTRSMPPAPVLETPRQPPGREPSRLQPDERSASSSA
ncbi:MAG: glycosyl hydrolase family 65 protein [Dehalococcoidia bacterium]